MFVTARLLVQVLLLAVGGVLLLLLAASPRRRLGHHPAALLMLLLPLGMRQLGLLMGSPSSTGEQRQSGLLRVQSGLLHVVVVVGAAWLPWTRPAFTG